MGSAAVGLVVNSVGGYESVDFLRPRFDFFEDNFSSVSGPLIVLKKGSSKLRSPSLGPLVYWTSVVSMPSESGFSGSPASPPLRCSGHLFPLRFPFLFLANILLNRRLLSLLRCVLENRTLLVFIKAGRENKLCITKSSFVLQFSGC